MQHLYLTLLDEQYHCGYFFSDEAVEYLVDNLDMGYEDAVRHVMRHTLLPTYEKTGPRRGAHVKSILRWALNCASDDELSRLQASEYPFLGDTEPPRLLFEWWWREVFGEEDWRGDDLCDAELVTGSAPEELLDAFGWHEVLDPEVLRFPRRDGLPPGHGAPADPNRQRPPLP